MRVIFLFQSPTAAACARETTHATANATIASAGKFIGHSDGASQNSLRHSGARTSRIRPLTHKRVRPCASGRTAMFPAPGNTSTHTANDAIAITSAIAPGHKAEEGEGGAGGCCILSPKSKSSRSRCVIALLLRAIEIIRQE